jgi:CRISPR-associated protein Cmr5
MSKKRIESYIPKAMEVLKDEFSDGVIPSAYNGYISSFGASIIQSGLLPTLALFTNQQANTEQDRFKLNSLILKVLDENSNNTLLEYVLNNNNQTILKQKILDISIALKLSIRTFELKKD